MADPLKQIDSIIHIVTPENISFEYRAAGPFVRFPAFLLDLLFRVVAFVVLLIAASFAGAAIGVSGFALLMILYFIMEWFYGALFETFMNGQTPGKRLLGLRVLTANGQPINGMQAVLRNLLRGVDLFPLMSLGVLGLPSGAYGPPTFLLGLVVMSMNGRYQRIGDLVAGTMVVREERRWLSGVAKLDDPRTVALAALLPVDLQVSRTLARALSMYVERRKFFSLPRRREIAASVGDPLIERFQLPADTSRDLLLCAVYYRTFIADRRDDERHATTVGSSPFSIVTS